MTDLKFLFLGPMGAGKTTAIATISDIRPLLTDVENTDQAQSQKEKTTVALDYGELKLDNGKTLKLFGAPGQERFRFMRDSLVANALGVIILIDNCRKNPIEDFLNQLEGIGKILIENRVVVGVGRTSSHSRPTVADYAEILQSKGLKAPVFSVDVRKAADVVLLIEALLGLIDIEEDT